MSTPSESAEAISTPTPTPTTVVSSEPLSAASNSSIMTSVASVVEEEDALQPTPVVQRVRGARPTVARHVHPRKARVGRPPPPVPPPSAAANIGAFAFPGPLPAVSASSHVGVRLAVGYRSVGHLLGPGGCTIRAIRSASGANIEVDAFVVHSPDRARVITIEGALAQVRVGVREIIRLLAERATIQAAQVPAAAGSNSNSPAGVPPHDANGSASSTGHASITRIPASSFDLTAQAPASATSSLSPASSTSSMASLSLTSEATPPPPPPPLLPLTPPRVSLVLLVPGTQLGAVIGHSKQSLDETRRVSGASVMPSAPPEVVDPRHDVEREVQLAGFEDNVARAADIILEQLCQMQATGTVTTVIRSATRREPALDAIAPTSPPTHPRAIPTPQFDPLLVQLHDVAMQLQQLGMQAAHQAMYVSPDSAQLQACRMQIDRLQHIYMALQSQIYQQHHQQQQASFAPPPLAQPALPLDPKGGPSLPYAVRSLPLKLHIPSSLLGPVIGRGGSTITHIREASGAAINIEPMSHPAQGHHRRRASAPITIEEAKCDDVKCDDEDPYLEEAQSSSATANSDSAVGTDGGSRLLVISGTNVQIEKAAQLIATILQAQPNKSHTPHEETKTLTMPEPRAMPEVPKPKHTRSRSQTVPSSSQTTVLMQAPNARRSSRSSRAHT